MTCRASRDPKQRTLTLASPLYSLPPVSVFTVHEAPDAPIASVSPPGIGQGVGGGREGQAGSRVVIIPMIMTYLASRKSYIQNTEKKYRP